MAKKNRELQRVPPEEAQRAALRSGRLTTVVSEHPVYGTLRTLLNQIRESDTHSPPSPGPKPKRDTLLCILDMLENPDEAARKLTIVKRLEGVEHIPIRTSADSPVVKYISAKLNKSEAQTRDLLHQLADLAEGVSDQS